jgi:hypothetical protein
MSVEAITGVCNALRSASLLFNQGNPGNRGKGKGVNVSKRSTQSARKNAASDTTEPIPNNTTSSLSRARKPRQKYSSLRGSYFRRGNSMIVLCSAILTLRRSSPCLTESEPSLFTIVSQQINIEVAIYSVPFAALSR